MGIAQFFFLPKYCKSTLNQNIECVLSDHLKGEFRDCGLVWGVGRAPLTYNSSQKYKIVTGTYFFTIVSTFFQALNSIGK